MVSRQYLSSQRKGPQGGYKKPPAMHAKGRVLQSVAFSTMGQRRLWFCLPPPQSDRLGGSIVNVPRRDQEGSAISPGNKGERTRETALRWKVREQRISKYILVANSNANVGMGAAHRKNWQPGNVSLSSPT